MDWTIPLFGYAIKPEDLRALSPGELQIRALAEMLHARNAGPPGIAELMGMQNFQPKVHVPEGWAEWSAHAHEMI